MPTLTTDSNKVIGTIMVEDGQGQHTTDEKKNIGIMVVDDGTGIPTTDSPKLIGRVIPEDGLGILTTDSDKVIGRVKMDDGSAIRTTDSRKIIGRVTLQGGGGGGPTGVHLLNNLISYWDMDGSGLLSTVSDRVGTNHLGSFGPPIFTPSGKINSCVSFSGSNNNLNIASNPSLEMSGNTSFFFSTWVNPSGLPTSGNFMAIISKASGPVPLDYQMDVWNDPSTGLAFRMIAWDSVQVAVVASTTGIIPVTGTWYHLVGWYDGGNKKTHICVNAGTVFDSPTAIPAGGVGVSSVQFNIGSSQFPGFYFFAGLIDETGLWKRQPSTAEIPQLFNGGAGWPLSSFTA